MTTSDDLTDDVANWTRRRKRTKLLPGADTATLPQTLHMRQWVDFGEMFAGDPAWDLAAAWVLLPAGTASRFFDMYELGTCRPGGT